MAIRSGVATNRRGLWRSRVRTALLLALGSALLTTVWFLLDPGFFTGTSARIVGSPLGNQAAPAFKLLDQDGQPLTLGALKGKVITVSFLYTSCVDICPVTAAKLAGAYRRLTPDEQSRVALLVVTVDPERDSQERRAAYIAAQQLPTTLRFLGGDPGDLQPVWRDFHIGVTRVPLGKNFYDVDYTSVTYLIDPWGHERALLRDADFAPEELATSIAALLH